MAGTIVGMVDEDDLLPRLDAMAEGDVLVGLRSSGLHTNGYSLARKVCFEVEGLKVSDELPGTGMTVADALLATHRSYLKPVMPLVKARQLVAMAHITGGGLTDNLPRVLPRHLDAVIDTASWEVPALFRFLSGKAGMPIEDARRSFNLGVGMVLACRKEAAGQVLGQLEAGGEAPWVLGELTKGEEHGLDAERQRDVLPQHGMRLARQAQRARDAAQVVVHQHHSGCFHGHAGAVRATHGEAHVGARQRRGIVDAVAGHAHPLATRLQCGNCLGLAIRAHTSLPVANAQLASHAGGGGRVVTSQHMHLDA